MGGGGTTNTSRTTAEVNWAASTGARSGKQVLSAPQTSNQQGKENENGQKFEGQEDK